MAHFAQLDEANVVTQVIVVNNETIENKSFPESEAIGVAFCKSLFGETTKWAQTSYNASFRYNFAGIGSTFDETASPNGAFLHPKPYASWILNTTTHQWEAPISYPNDGERYYWDEPTVAWVPQNIGE